MRNWVFLLAEDNFPTKLEVMTLVESGLCEGGGYLWQKRERMPALGVQCDLV